MTATLGPVPTADQQRRIDRRTWILMYLGVLVVSAALGYMTMQSTPAPLGIPLTMLVIASVVVLARPVAGIYLIGFFTFATDASTAPWYPFAWPLSSQNSILYLGNGLKISPLEILLVVTMVAWLLRLWIDRGALSFVRGTLLWPILAFTGFVVLGLVVGLGTGGDRYAAMWEFRPFPYLPIVYVLVTNLFTTRLQYRRLLLIIGVALLLDALLALQVFSTLSEVERDSLETLVSHGTAVLMGAVLFAAIAAWLLRRAPSSARLLLPLACIPIGWAWLLSQRRAAVIGLAVALLALLVMLWKLNRRLLYRVGPLFALVTVAYLAAFWNSESTLGFPAQAVKTVIAPGDISERDKGSDLYRVIENYDISATIHAKPITGMGFGQKFLRPAALPDISFFPFYEYITHNSVLWIWIKMGVGGFVAMLFLFGSALRRGVRAVVSLTTGRDVLTVLVATGYLVMYVVFAYVDIAWDWWSMVAVAISMAVCSEYVRLPSGRDERQLARRALAGAAPLATRRPVPID